jgi:uncharacterized protein
MTRRRFALALLAGALLAGPWASQPARAQRSKKRVLVITHAAGFKHSSRPVAAETVRRLGNETGDWEVIGVADNQDQVRSYINADALKNIHLVVFANTTGDLGFTPEGKQAFYDWIRNGGAYVGIHSASDTYHGDPQYLDLVRGEFLTHGAQVKVTAYNQDPKHPATKDLPASFEIYDEIYEFKNWDRGRVHVLLTMNRHPQKMDQAGDFPIAWTNRIGRGRMFYTSLGHREDVYQNELYLKHLTGGIRWALGQARGSDQPGNPQVP